MKYLLPVAILLVLAGCKDAVEERKFSAMPKELEDCRVFYVQNRDGQSMTVVRCPHSATTAETRSGKTTSRSVTVDGIEYVEVKK